VVGRPKVAEFRYTCPYPVWFTCGAVPVSTREGAVDVIEGGEAATLARVVDG
jgi:hypothetical protein